MKRLIMGTLLVMLLLVLVACGAPEADVAPSMPAPVPAPAPAPMPRPEPMPPGIVVDKGGIIPGTEEERMIIRSGDMSLVVADVVKARDEIAQLAERFDGYVVSSWISGEEAEMRGNISIRVPDDKFEPALAELRKLAVRVKSESTSSSDVTEEYIDLQARLKNAEAVEGQYLALVDRAEAVEDILKIYDALSRVRYEIEQIKGRMQYLERTSAMSFISVQLEPATTPPGVVRPGWSALEVIKSAVRGIVVFGQWLGTFVIWLAIFSPLWGAIIGLIYWRYRRRKKGRQGG